MATVSVDDGKLSTESDSYTALGQPQSETFGSAGNASVNYAYYPTSSYGTSGSPDAAWSVAVDTPGGQSASQVYTYNSATQRLRWITINGSVKANYAYLSDSNQISSLSVGDVITTYVPDAADGSRLGSMSVSAAGQVVYSAAYTYNADGQRTSDQITQTVAANDGTTTSQSQTLTYTYDPNQADALTQVKDGNGNVLYSYNFDGVGNITSNGSLGSANSVNEYSNLTYNPRHDLTNDGNDTYVYDALDRLISVTPNYPSTGSSEAEYGYDGQGRMAWEEIFNWAGSTTYHFVWSGSELVAKLDANDNLLQQYTWGPGANGVDQVLLLTNYSGSTGTSYTLTYDASGNVIMMENPLTGAVVANYAYTPYGALILSTGPEAGINPWLGKGYWTDAAVDPAIAWAQPDLADGTTRTVDLPAACWMQDDPTGINGGLNLKSVDGNDPINNVDPNGTTYETIEGVSGIRWNQSEGRAEIGLAVTISPSWYNWPLGVSDTDRANAVSVRWVPINSLPKEYASVAGLQRLANWDKQPIRDQMASSILEALRLELQTQEAVQQAVVAGKNAMGPTGLGPTGDGLLTGVLLETLGSVIKVGGAARTAEELRGTPGTVTVSQDLAPASGRWLEANRPAPIPAQVAQKLKGQQFNTFADLRSAIWKTIAADPELSKTFSAANLGNMGDGNAPFAPRAFQINGSDAGRRFNLHHITPIENGGSVYDLSNLQIVSPAVHVSIHNP